MKQSGRYDDGDPARFVWVLQPFKLCGSHVILPQSLALPTGGEEARAMTEALLTGDDTNGEGGENWVASAWVEL
jgi:hypothetical protein